LVRRPREVDGISITVRPQMISNRRMAYVRLRWDLAGWSGERWFGLHQMKAQFPQPISLPGWLLRRSPPVPVAMDE